MWVHRKRNPRLFKHQQNKKQELKTLYLYVSGQISDQVNAYPPGLCLEPRLDFKQKQVLIVFYVLRHLTMLSPCTMRISAN